jgi:hypothetical protein
MKENVNHPKEEDLMAYRDGEPGDRNRIADHLKGCSECRSELERIEAVFAALNAMPVPDPGEHYGRRVWQQIAARLPEKRVSWWTGVFAPRRLAAFGAVAAMIVVAFLAGRWIRVGPAPAPVQQTEEAKTRERILWLAVGEHLGRSEMMLVELANTEPRVLGAKQVNISPEQRRAEDLLDENRLYRQTALNEGDTALVSVLDELERVLLDVAHSPDSITPAQLHTIQQRIGSQGILFKLRVVKQQLRERQAANPVAPRNTSKIQERNKA